MITYWLVITIATTLTVLMVASERRDRKAGRR